jgi:uncharacterized protein (DUF427 family)
MSAGTGQIPDAAAAERDYPQMPVQVNHVEPAPRRIRGVLGNELIFDTTSARYVWEIPYYPQYYIPLADIDPQFLADENAAQSTRRGTARRHGLRVGEVERPGAVRVYGADAIEGVADTAHFDWAALDAWYEEDEQVFVHPRSPYTRVDALRSHRQIRVSLDGVTLAQTASPVLVFETGLPTRYYIDRTDVDFAHLVPSDTQTACPYKGVTSGYWSVRLTEGRPGPGPAGGAVRDEHKDLAWAYDFPTRQLLPIAGMVAFYNEKLDIEVDGRPLPRPRTHFS